MKWNSENEQEVLRLRSAGFSYEKIAKALGATASSVKHKARRLGQSANLDKYKHTEEKRAQAAKFLVGSNLHILETHGGFGGMTEFYRDFGEVECYDIKQDRVDAVNNMGMENVTAVKGDSEKEIYRLLAFDCRYDVVDIDPYGMPSRYFPHAFSLVDDGLMLITLPMVGVAQMNKITIRHLHAFWGVTEERGASYVDAVLCRLADYAFMHGRGFEVLDVAKIDRIYRLCLRVKKESLCDLVGLRVSRGSCQIDDKQLDIWE